MGGTPHDGLYGKAPPERGIFFRLQVDISLNEVYERAKALSATLAAALAVLKEKRTSLRGDVSKYRPEVCKSEK